PGISLLRLIEPSISNATFSKRRKRFFTPPKRGANGKLSNTPPHSGLLLHCHEGRFCSSKITRPTSTSSAKPSKPVGFLVSSRSSKQEAKSRPLSARRRSHHGPYALSSLSSIP